MALTDWVGYAQRTTEVITAHVIAPLVILLLGWMAAKLVERLILRIGKATELNKHTRTVLGQRLDITEFLGSSAAAIVYTVTGVWFFVAAGIAREALLILIGALGAFGFVGLVLWLRDLLPNLFAGFRMRRQLQRGQTLRVDGLEGTVERLGPLSARLRWEDRILIIPYSTLKK